MTNEELVGIFAALTIVITVLHYVALTGDLSEAHAKRSASRSGYTSVQIVSPSFDVCSEHDSYGYSIKARDHTGQDIQATMCCVWFKQCHVEGISFRF